MKYLFIDEAMILISASYTDSTKEIRKSISKYCREPNLTDQALVENLRK